MRGLEISMLSQKYKLDNLLKEPHPSRRKRLFFIAAFKMLGL
jgi:hypothetical protein